MSVQLAAGKVLLVIDLYVGRPTFLALHAHTLLPPFYPHETSQYRLSFFLYFFLQLIPYYILLNDYYSILSY